MRFSVAAVLTLAVSVIAAPSGLGGLGALTPQATSPFPKPGGDVTVASADDTCGSQTELSCCNHVDQSGDSTMVAEGLLAGALQGVLAGGEVGLFSGCSKLNVAAVIGLSDLLNDQCTQTAACCQRSGTNQEGLVNVGLPCVALGSLL